MSLLGRSHSGDCNVKILATHYIESSNANRLDRVHMPGKRVIGVGSCPWVDLVVCLTTG